MGVFLEKARDVSRTAIITHRYHPHPPPPPSPFLQKKMLSRMVVLMSFSAKGNSDKTHRTFLNALARGFGKERKGNYHASKSDFR